MIATKNTPLLNKFLKEKISKKQAIDHINWLQEDTEWTEQTKEEVPKAKKDILNEFIKIRKTIETLPKNYNYKKELIIIVCKAARYYMILDHYDGAKVKYEWNFFNEAIESFNNALEYFEAKKYINGFYYWLRALRLAGWEDNEELSPEDLVESWWIAED